MEVGFAPCLTSDQGQPPLAQSGAMVMLRGEARSPPCRNQLETCKQEDHMGNSATILVGCLLYFFLCVFYLGNLPISNQPKLKQFVWFVGLTNRNT